MKTVFVLTLCLAVAWAATPMRQDSEADNSKILMKRDYKAPDAPPIDSYSAPPSGQSGDGLYYYYYPTEEHGAKEVKQDKCLVEKLLTPIILITIFLGIIAASVTGLLPNLGNLIPTIPIPITIPNIPVVPGVGRALDEMTLIVTKAVESEECLPLLICESGKYAHGYNTMVGILDYFTPRVFQSKMKIFKDAATKKTDCKQYRCSFVDGKKV